MFPIPLQTARFGRYNWWAPAGGAEFFPSALGWCHSSVFAIGYGEQCCDASVAAVRSIFHVSDTLANGTFRQV